MAIYLYVTTKPGSRKEVRYPVVFKSATVARQSMQATLEKMKPGSIGWLYIVRKGSDGIPRRYWLMFVTKPTSYEFKQQGEKRVWGASDKQDVEGISYRRMCDAKWKYWRR